uniref:Uncharacterized protein n=1 Tax=viral metagenome TaxID=1070528 RepID=A0A6M3IP03_9ZZZZ
MWPFDRRTEEERRKCREAETQYRADLRKALRSRTEIQLLLVAMSMLLEGLGYGDLEEEEIIQELRTRAGLPVDH